MPAFYITVSLTLFGLSLLFDAAQMAGGRHIAALQMLLYGPWGLPYGLNQWFANPLWALAVLSHNRFRRLALLCGLGAAYLAVASLGIERLPDNVSYAFHGIEQWSMGFYLWLAAIGTLLIGQLWWCWRARTAADVPAWRALDAMLIIALVLGIYYAATQMSWLDFEVDRLLLPPPPTVEHSI